MSLGISPNTGNSAYSPFMQLQPKQRVVTEPVFLQKNGSHAPIAAVELNESTKEKKSHALTVAVASVAITGSVIGLLLTKGASSKFSKYLDTCMQKLDDKIYKYTTEHKKLSTMQQGYLKFNKGIRKCLEVGKLGNNITAVKDAGFMMLCEKLHLTGLMNWITNGFKKITVRTSKKSYETARNIADTNIAELHALANALEKTDPCSAQEIRKILHTISHDIFNVTSAKTRKERLVQIEQATSGIGKKVSDDLVELCRNRSKETLENWRIYRTEAHAAQARETLSSEFTDTMRRITFNIQDKVKLMREMADDLGRIISPNDTASRNVLRELRKQLDEYSRLGGSNETTIRSELAKKMNVNISALRDSFLRGKPTDESKQLFESKLDEIKKLVNNHSDKGQIEEILTLLNNPAFRKANPQEYARAKVLTQEIRSSLNKAFDNELKLFDKFAEYSVGSAPTDVLGMLLPAGLAVYAVSKSEDKDARVSATLKSGIPILGGVGMTFIAAAKMMSNMQGLLLGGLVGLGLNAVGSKADEGYKAYQEKNLFTQKALAAYRKQNNLNIS